MFLKHQINVSKKLNSITGQLTVSTGGNVSGMFNGSVTIDCTVTLPEPNHIQWIKYPNNVPEAITVDNTKYTGGSLTTIALTINMLNKNDASEYQCQARNPGGTYGSSNRATVTVVCKYTFCVHFMFCLLNYI